MTHLITVGLLALACLPAGLVAAQNFPHKPVRLILGPGPDVLARLVGQRLTESWGQQVVVDQRPGASGVIAVELAARAAPDGYTLLLSTGSYVVSTSLNPQSKLDLARDLAPVSQLATIPFVLVVHPRCATMDKTFLRRRAILACRA